MSESHVHLIVVIVFFGLIALLFVGAFSCSQVVPVLAGILAALAFDRHMRK